jgi:hypothetical protein
VSASLTYVFCLVRSARRPAVPELPVSNVLPDSRDPRALPAGDDLWLIATTVSPDEYNEAALARGLQNLEWVARRAMAHEAMIEHFLSARAVLPMQLFTLFSSDQRALQHVTRQRTAILGILQRIERKVEWGLRLTFDEAAVRNAVETTARRSVKGAPTGTSYLAHKRDLLDVTRGQLQAARAEAERLFTALQKDAAESRRRTETEQASAGARLLLDAAFLVPASRVRAFRAAVARHARKIGATGIVVSLTGPWPPYNFISPSPLTKRARGKA